MDRRSTLRLGVAACTALILRPASAEGFSPYEAARFQEAVTAGGAVIVHVHADWCPTCRVQQPVLTDLSRDAAFRNVRFVRVDFDRDREFLTRYRVPSQSAILVFRGGREVARFAGVTDRAEIVSRVRAAAVG